MPHDMVRVVYTKYDGSAHRDYPARRFDEDDLGVWVGVTRGTASVYHGRPSVEQIPFVLLIPHSAWWTGMFNPPPRTSEVYCDITTPARWIVPVSRSVVLGVDHPDHLTRHDKTLAVRRFRRWWRVRSSS